MDGDIEDCADKGELKSEATEMVVVDPWPENIELNKLCRSCANTSESFIKIFEDEGVKHELAAIINKHLPIKVTERDKLPKSVCYSCASTLIAFHDLVNKCVKSEMKLNELLNQSLDQSKELSSNEDQCSDSQLLDDESLVDDDSCDAPPRAKDILDNSPVNAKKLNLNVTTSDGLSLEVIVEQDVDMDGHSDPLEIQTTSNEIIEPDPALPSTSKLLSKDSSGDSQEDKERCSSPKQSLHDSLNVTVIKINELQDDVKTENSYLCDYCNLCFDADHELQEHVYLNHPESILKDKCTIIGVDVTASVKSDDYVQRPESGTSEKCYKEKYQNVIVGKSNKKMKCPVCSNLYSGWYNLFRHFRNKHPDSKIPDKKTCVIEVGSHVCSREYNHKYAIKRQTRLSKATVLNQSEVPDVGGNNRIMFSSDNDCKDETQSGIFLYKTFNDVEFSTTGDVDGCNSHVPDNLINDINSEEMKQSKCAGDLVDRFSQIQSSNDYTISNVTARQCSEKFICDHCKKGFKQKRSLAYHIKIKHSSNDLPVPNGNNKSDLLVRFSTFDIPSHNIVNEEINSNVLKCKYLNCGQFYEKSVGIKHSCDKCSDFNTEQRGDIYTVKRKNDVKLQSDEIVDIQISQSIIDQAIKPLESVTETMLMHVTPENRFSCSVCEKSYSRKADVKRHYRSKHPFEDSKQQMKAVMHGNKNPEKQSDEYVVCEPKLSNTCDLSSECHDPVDNKLQQNSTGPVKLQCSICGRKYSRTYDLKKHFEIEHPDAKQSVIDDCTIKISNVSPMSGAGEKFKCKFCRRKRLLKQDLKWHIRGLCKSNTKTYMCHHCGKLFHKHFSFKYHVENFHGGVKNYACDICGRKFAQKSFVAEHRRIHTGERPYMCDLCGKSFSAHGSLVYHRRTHTDYYPFHCTLCDRKFRKRQHYEDHLTLHTGEKKYSCDICGKRFRVLRSMTQHKHLHYDLYPFKCNVCTLTFKLKRYLRNHIKIKHGNSADSQVPLPARYSPSSNKTRLLAEMCLNDNSLNPSNRSVDHVNCESLVFCLHCNLSFSNERKLDEHLTYEHSDVKTDMIVADRTYSDVICEINSRTTSLEKFHCLSCKKCYCTSQSEHSLRIGQKFVCECGQTVRQNRVMKSLEPVGNSCNLILGNSPEFTDHEFLNENRTMSTSTKDSKSLIDSVTKKRAGLFICTICGNKFKQKLSLIKHCLRLHKVAKEHNKPCEPPDVEKHDVEKNMPCSYCNKCYARKSDLVRHQLKKHLDESKQANIIRTIDHMDAEVLKSAEMEVEGSIIYHCKLCKKNIVTKRGYIRHVRIHTGERPFTCHICGKQYRSSADLTRHLRSVHDGIKNYSCDICGRCFANKGTRNDHRRIHTGERPYICDICGKAFPTANSIYVHRRIHTDYFPYQCTSCDKRFRRRQQLIHHVRTHTGEKPHACDVCGKCFGVKDELSRHLRTHSMDKPFACSECGLCFGQKRYLSKHIRTQHNIAIDIVS